jgi:ethanolamine ammonia-lyase small subunit
LHRLQADSSQTWSIAPVAVVEQGRVAIGDEVGEQLRANTVVVLIGERPGLSSPDSLGIYLTWAPKVGSTDAARNCISNIRPAGLSIDAAARTLHQLLTKARQLQLTGVDLKDDVDALAPSKVSERLTT